MAACRRTTYLAVTDAGRVHRIGLQNVEQSPLTVPQESENGTVLVRAAPASSPRARNIPDTISVPKCGVLRESAVNILGNVVDCLLVATLRGT